jgi:hypothetical protein
MDDESGQEYQRLIEGLWNAGGNDRLFFLRNFNFYHSIIVYYGNDHHKKYYIEITSKIDLSKQIFMG